MNIVSRKQLEYHNHSTQQCLYNARVGLPVYVVLYLLSVVCLNFLEVWPGPPTDVLHIAVCSVLLSVNSS